MIFIDSRESRREREGKRENRRSAASHTHPNRGWNRHPPEPDTLWFTGQHSNHCATPARSCNLFNKNIQGLDKLASPFFPNKQSSPHSNHRGGSPFPEYVVHFKPYLFTLQSPLHSTLSPFLHSEKFHSFIKAQEKVSIPRTSS